MKSQKILRRPEVQQITGLSRSSIYRRLSAGQFPKPFPLGGRCVGWLETDILQWIDNCIAEANQ